MTEYRINEPVENYEMPMTDNLRAEVEHLRAKLLELSTQQTLF